MIIIVIILLLKRHILFLKPAQTASSYLQFLRYNNLFETVNALNLQLVAISLPNNSVNYALQCPNFPDGSEMLSPNFSIEAFLQLLFFPYVFSSPTVLKIFDSSNFILPKCFPLSSTLYTDTLFFFFYLSVRQ